MQQIERISDAPDIQPHKSATTLHVVAGLLKHQGEKKKRHISRGAANSGVWRQLSSSRLPGGSGDLHKWENEGVILSRTLEGVPSRSGT